MLSMDPTALPNPNDPFGGRLTITVAEAARLLGIGRSAAYVAVHRGEIPHVRYGRLYLVPVHRLLAMLGADGPS